VANLKYKTPSMRFYERVEMIPEAGCWIWLGSYSGSGYGAFSLTIGPYKSLTEAHRASYWMFKGPIPKGMHIDHLCKVKQCVNPYHLDCVTPRENIMRSCSPSAINVAKTHCIVGHPFSKENTYWHKNKRGCRICRKNQWEDFKSRSAQHRPA